MDEKLEKALLDQAIVGLWPKIQAGDPKAIDRVLRLLERKERREKPKKRRYTLTRKALAQRRRAALKTGEHAELPVNRLAGRISREETPGSPAVQVDAELVKLFEQALDGDPKTLRELTAGQMAALVSPFHAELAQLQEEVLAQEVPILDPDGEPLEDENGEVICRTISNPRAEPVLKLAQLLGLSAEQLRLTPKSRSEGELTDATADIRRFMLESFQKTEANRTKK